MTAIETFTGAIEVHELAETSQGDDSPQLSAGEKFMGFTAPMQRDWVDLGMVPAIREVAVDIDDPYQWGVFKAVYERCDKPIEYPLGAVVCRSVLVVKDVIVEDEGISTIRPVALAGAALGWVDGEVVPGSGAVTKWHGPLTPLAVTRFAMRWREAVTHEESQFTPAECTFLGRFCDDKVTAFESIPPGCYVDGRTGILRTTVKKALAAERGEPPLETARTRKSDHPDLWLPPRVYTKS